MSNMISDVRYIYQRSDIYIGGQIYISEVRYIYIYISDVRYDIGGQIYISDLKISGETC